MKPLIFEIILISGVFALLFTNKQFRSNFNGLPRILKLCVSGILCLLVAGHFARSSRSTFPFVHWDMYTVPNGDPTINHFEIRGVTPEGRAELINPSHLYPSLGLGTFRIHNHIHNIGAAIYLGNNEEMEKGEELLRAISETYLSRNPDKAFTEVSLILVTEPFKSGSFKLTKVITIKLS